MGNRHRWFLHLTQKASVPAHRQRRGRLKPSYLVISLVSSSPIATIPWFFRESERAALCCARDPPFRTQPPPCPQREGRTEPIDTTIETCRNPPGSPISYLPHASLLRRLRMSSPCCSPAWSTPRPRSSTPGTSTSTTSTPSTRSLRMFFKSHSMSTKKPNCFSFISFQGQGQARAGSASTSLRRPCWRGPPVGRTP